MLSKILRIFRKPFSTFIKVGVHDTVGMVKIDRPEALNAINAEMFRTLYNVLRDLEERKSFVIVGGAGDKAFAAGIDFKEVSLRSTKNCREVYRHMCKSYDLVAHYKKPYIAIMDGMTMGGASAFAVPGKYRVVTERSIYSLPETAIGFFNFAGASYFLSRMPLNIGLYLGMTGVKMAGYDVKKIGLATHFVESRRLEDLEKALLACKNDEEIGKALAKLSSVPTTIETELDSILPLIDKCFDGESVEEIYENLHLDGSEWAMDTIRVLNKMSPTSLKVAHKSITMGKTLSLHDCLRAEYRVAVHHVMNSDFQEGIRALLVEKDFKPKWNPATLHDVTEQHVERFFKPLPDGDEVTFETS